MHILHFQRLGLDDEIILVEHVITEHHIKHERWQHPQPHEIGRGESLHIEQQSRQRNGYASQDKNLHGRQPIKGDTLRLRRVIYDEPPVTVYVPEV